MARLSKKETRLLLAFSITIFLAVNMLAMKRYLTSLTLVRSQVRAYTAQRQKIDGLLSDRAYWQERQQWLAEHQPSLDNTGAAQGTLIETLQKAARDGGITILDQTILEPSIKPYYQAISVKLKVTAPMKDMVNWLAEIQAPERFLSIDALSVTVDPRSKELDPPAICTLQVACLYTTQPTTRNPRTP